MKRLGVLGTFVWDRIWHPATGLERPVEQWGGIAYSLSAFAATCPAGWTIVPIVRVGWDLWEPALDFVRSLPHVDPHDGLTAVPRPNNRVELRYSTPADRTEQLTGGVGSWEWGELVPLVRDLDGLYVNFISGHELDLATAERLGELPVPTYADLHSLFLGSAEGGPRPPRKLPHWERWLAAFDAVQLNEAELRLLAHEATDPLSLLRSLPDLGPFLTLVTRGSLGAEYACRVPLPAAAEWPEVRPLQLEDSQIQTGGLATPWALGSGDPTGCGDIWGSVLFASLLEGVELADAIQRAHGAAAAKLRSPRIDTLVETIATGVRDSRSY